MDQEILFDHIGERESLWHNLQRESRPIVIYGMGNGAEKILDACDTYGIKIAEVFASDEYVRNHSFRGYQVKRLREIEGEFEDFVILLAFAVHTEELIEWIHQLGEKHTLYAPDLPVCGGTPFTYEYYLEHQQDFQRAFALMGDEESRLIFANIINFKISGKLCYLNRYSYPDEDLKNLLAVTPHESYLDLGAYDGDTIRQLQRVSGGYKKAVALEPDRKNFKKLQRFAETQENLTIYPVGSYSHSGQLSFDVSGSRNSAIKEDAKGFVEVVACDDLAECDEISYIKMDVEGAEAETLLGCRKIIAEHHPKLNVSAYHRNDDLFVLPLLIKELWGGYQIYMRKHRYIPAWEVIIYGKK